MTANRIKSLQEQHGAKKKEADAILEPARKENRACSAQELEKHAALEKEIDALQATIFTEIRALQAAASAAPERSAAEQRDIESFDLSAVVQHVLKGTRLEGLEAELITEGEREARAANLSVSGVMLPRVLVQWQGTERRARQLGLERRDMSVTGGTTAQYGGAAVQTDKLGLLDSLYNALVLRQAGATFLTGLTNNFDWPAYVAPSAPTHKTENQASDELSPTVTAVSFAPNRLPAHIDISDQLMIQAPALEAVVRRNILEQLVSLVEYQGFHGGGTTAGSGVAGTSGIGSVAGGTNGAVPTWANIVALNTKVAVQNAARGTCHYISNFKVKGQLESTVRAASSDSVMILDPDRPDARICGYQPLWTNNVSSTLTKGSSGAVASAIFFGQWVDLVMAFWGGLELDVVRDKTLATQGQRCLVANIYYDCNVVRAKSFAAMLDALTTNVD